MTQLPTRNTNSAVTRTLFHQALVVGGLFLTLFASIASADTYYSTYGASRTHNISVIAATHYFQVDAIAAYKNTEWYVNGIYKETDQSGYWGDDPELTRNISATTKIEALVYDRNWNLEEKHIWNLTIAKPDLIVSSVTGVASSYKIEEKISATATIKNAGSVPAGGSKIKYYLVSCLRNNFTMYKDFRIVSQPPTLWRKSHENWSSEATAEAP
jgi:hypothetical protein